MEESCNIQNSLTAAWGVKVILNPKPLTVYIHSRRYSLLSWRLGYTYLIGSMKGQDGPVQSLLITLAGSLDFGGYYRGYERGIRDTRSLDYSPCSPVLDLENLLT